jgi:uracil-DNA glycosylase
MGAAANLAREDIRCVRDGQTDRASALSALRGRLDGCVRCDALVRCRSRVVPGAGAAPATVAFVGIAPGRFGGDRTGIPFSGDRSGELLRRMIRRARLSRVFTTNIVRCNPRDAAGRNRDPSAAEIANCREYLAAELALIEPRLVICLGRIAWRELAGPDYPFSPGCMKIVHRGSFTLHAMYHPAYIVRGAYSEGAYARDFRRVARMLAAPVVD